MPLERRTGLPDEDDDGFNPLKIPGAILGDIGEFGAGLGRILGALASDAFYGVSELWGGGPPRERGYLTDDIIKAIPGAIAQDYKRRYGSVKGFATGIEEDPLFFLADIFGAAGLAGKGARAAGVTSQTAKTPLAKFLVPGDKTRFVGTKLEKMPGLQNPLLRAIVDKAEGRFATQSVSALEQDIGALRMARELRPLTPNELKKLNEMETIVTQARQHGLERVSSPKLREHLYRRKAWKLDGERRNFTLQGILTGQRAFPRKMLEELDDDQVATANKVIDGEDYTIQDLERLGYIDENGPVLRTQIDLPIYGQVDGMSAEAAAQAVEELGDTLDVATLDRRIIDAMMDEPGRVKLQEFVARSDEAGTLSPAAERVRLFIGRNAAEQTRRAEEIARYVTAAAPLYRKMRQLEEAPQLAQATERGFGKSVNIRRADDDTSDIIRQHDDTRRLLRAHFSEMVNEAKTPVDAFQKQLRLAVLEHLTNPLLERGGFSPTKILERTYLRQRRSRIERARPGEEVFDYESGTFRDVPESNPLAIDDEYFANGRPMPIYRHERAADLEDMGIELVSKDGKELIRQGEGTVGVYRRGPEGVGVTKPSGHRKARGVLADDMRDLNIENAYAHQLAAQTKYFELRDMLDRVAQYGRPVSDVEMVAPDVERWVNLAALDRVMRIDGAFESRLAQLVGDGVEAQDALQEAFRSVLSPVGRETVEQFAQWREGAAAGQLVAVPRKVADDLERLLKPHLGPGSRAFFDQATDAWRFSVLSLSPRWIVNNFIGNIIFLKLHGGRLTDVLRQFQPEFRKALREALGERGSQLIGPGFARSMQAPIAAGRKGSAVEVFAQKVTEKTRRTPLRYIRKFGELMNNINSGLEDAFRMAGVLTAAEKASIRKGVKSTASRFWESKKRLEQIAKGGGDPQLLDEWAGSVNRMFNDYQMQSPNGRNIVRRFIYPFWGFYRHMAKTTLMLPFEHAERFVAWRQVTQIGKDFDEEYGPLPNYAKGAFRIGPGTEPGAFDFLSTRGANPFEGMDEPLAKAVSSAHPLVRILVEQATGRSTFTGRKFSDPDIFSPFGSEQQFRVVRDADGNPVDVERDEYGNPKPIGRVAPNIIEHLLQMVPQYDLAKDALAGGRTADTATIIDALREKFGGRPGAVVRRAETGQPVAESDFLEMLGRLFGVSTFGVNQKDYEERLGKDAAAALRYALKLTKAERKAEE